MSLVAYDSSDEDSENGETEKTVTNESTIDPTTVINVRTTSKLSLPAPKLTLQDTDNENEGSGDDFRHILDMLPTPRDLNSAAECVEEDDDIPIKRIREHEAAKPTKKQTVKIRVPSLSEFEDVEEEDEKKPSRAAQPSAKGCGLFAVLAAPRGQSTSNKTLIPHTVRNVKQNIQQTKSTARSGVDQTNVRDLKGSIVSKTHQESSSDEEEDEADVDFFGLTASESAPDNTASGSREWQLPSEGSVRGSRSVEEASFPDEKEDSAACNSSFVTADGSTSDQSNASSKTLTSNVMNLPKEEILLKNRAEIGPKLPVPEQEYNIDTEGNVAFDEKAIEYLCGRRGVKRKDREIGEANIIEINGEDIKPDEREWLVKALTEEPVHRPVSMQNCGVNSQSKKKHQITFLAQQAKAMELELKNQWSQNRMTRKQTKSKYGF